MKIDTMQGDKIIAKFMGGQFKEDLGWLSDNQVLLRDHGVCRTDVIGWEKHTTTDVYLQYHSSWDWLIPVIGKIHSLEEYFNEYKDDDSHIFGQRVEVCVGNIGNTYEEVIEFIKWYNKDRYGTQK